MSTTPRPNTALALHEKRYAPFKVHAVMRALSELGVDTKLLLAGSSLSQAEASSAHTRISVHQFLVVCRNAGRLSPKAGWAALVGGGMRLTDYGMYGYALLSAPSMQAAMERALRFHAHRLASGTAGANEPLGVLYLAQRFWRRDADGSAEDGVGNATGPIVFEHNKLDGSPLPFPGLSSDSANLTVWYDKGPINARLAYNYRSRYLVSAADNSGQPVYRDPTGYLDGKITWKPQQLFGVQNISFFVEGKNLTKEEERSTAGDIRLTELGYFGRRFFVGMGLKF
ncbi:AraC family transcriptional regulator ligand-binding domain-containing protein [uncultured Caulobacter sp.]|uniref:AraC family transcriptional regulator ligand-binding domain-containing protein n=1 Tax=uncultured Caulobacter sp. TaxID=158749 RepID=UPI00260423E8|nr:AraC family transcriptional regulator ligand-binding domain-containing protein [uncultured Caulobacter sp.]